jgi:hypothetical protein
VDVVSWASGTWARTIAVPESSLQQVFAASLTFAAGIAVIVLS